MNPDLDVKDVKWIDANGSEMTPETWDNELTRCFGMLLDGRAQATGIKRRGGDVTLLIVLNAHHDVVEFSLPRCCDLRGWKRLIDTNDPGSAGGGVRDRARLRSDGTVAPAVRTHGGGREGRDKTGRGRGPRRRGLTGARAVRRRRRRAVDPQRVELTCSRFAADDRPACPGVSPPSAGAISKARLWPENRSSAFRPPGARRSCRQSGHERHSP